MLERAGVSTNMNNLDTLCSDLLIIAVKPQQFSELTKEIAGKIKEKTIVLSIMAAVPIKTIRKQLRVKRIVRVMPNTPALISEGVLAWYPKNCSPNEKKSIQQILSSCGFAFEVEKESQIDDISCVSGSGPGFFFYLFQQWLEATKTLNVPEKIRKNLLIKTLKGSLALLEHDYKSPLELVQQVASKGGITEQGLQVLEKSHLKQTFESMLQAAYKRCKEIAV